MAISHGFHHVHMMVSDVPIRGYKRGFYDRVSVRKRNLSCFFLVGV